MTIASEHLHNNCPRINALCLCVVFLNFLLDEEPDLKARLEANPGRTIHFFVDLHRLQEEGGDLDWYFHDDEDDLTVVDERLENPWASLTPVIHMQAAYSEMRDKIT